MALRPAHRGPAEPVAGDDAAAAAGDQAAADVEPRARRVRRAPRSRRTRCSSWRRRRRRRRPGGTSSRRGERDGGFLDDDRRGGQRSTSICTPRSARCARRPAAIEAALIVADELEDDGYLRVPLAEVAARHRLRAAEALAGLAPGPGLRSGRRRRAQPRASAWRCSCASATGSTRRCRRCSTTSPLAARGRLAELQARLRRRRRGPRRHAGRAPGARPEARPALRAGARSRSRCPTCTCAARADGSWTVELNTETLPRVLRQQRLRRGVGRGDAGGPRLRLGMQRQRELAGAQPRAARAHHPEGRDARSSQRQERFFSLGVARAAAADPARGRRPARPARIDRQPGDGRQVPRPATRAASSSASSSARRSRRSPAARPSPPPRCRSESAASSHGEPAAGTAVGRQNRRGAQRARGLILRGGRLRNTVKEWASRRRWSAAA